MEVGPVVVLVEHLDDDPELDLPGAWGRTQAVTRVGPGAPRAPGVPTVRGRTGEEPSSAHVRATISTGDSSSCGDEGHRDTGDVGGCPTGSPAKLGQDDLGGRERGCRMEGHSTEGA